MQLSIPLEPGETRHLPGRCLERKVVEGGNFYYSETNVITPTVRLTFCRRTKLDYVGNRQEECCAFEG
jgi:hypothetical protein